MRSSETELISRLQRARIYVEHAAVNLDAEELREAETAIHAAMNFIWDAMEAAEPLSYSAYEVVTKPGVQKLIESEPLRWEYRAPEQCWYRRKEPLIIPANGG